MFRIQRLPTDESVVFLVSGRIETENVSQLELLLTAESKPIVFDLKEVTLVNREVVQFLAQCENDGVTIRNCPAYIREWMVRD
jgi:hypothetical protein